MTRRMTMVVLAVLITGCGGAGRAAAQAQARPFSDGEKAFIGGVGLALAAFEVKKDFLAPDTCSWCESNSLDKSFRERFRRDTPPGRIAAGRWSDITGFGSGLFLIGVNALAARNGNHDEIETSSLTIIESGLVSLTLSNIVKRIAARQRPFLSTPEEGRPHDPDDHLSFYSGHTTLAFAVAVSAGRMADIYDYDAAPAVWAAGLSMAVATGYLRMASDKHYFTDVLAGAATGAVVGLVAANRRRVDEDEGAGAPGIRIVLHTDGQRIGVGLR